jgi:phage terminase large subunit-like protein
MPRNLDRKTLGPKVGRVMTAMGCPPMPWQQYVLDVAFEIDPETGLLAYRKIGLSVPRQQGKTELVFAVMLHRIMAWPRQNVTYAAQTRGMARTRFQDELLSRLEDSPLFGKFNSRLSNGSEAIIWKTTRSRLGITANTEKAGHGPPLDLGMIDEAFAHEDDRLEQAMSPAMSTRANAQMWWTSAGGTTKSNFLNAKRKLGREMIEKSWATGDWSQSVAHFEWYAPEDLVRYDPSTWASCMPALGITVSVETIRAEFESMDEPEADRAYLNRTRKPTPPDDPNVPKKEWHACVDKESQATDVLAFGIDIAPLRDYASISVASMQEDGRIHVELVDRRPGTDWLVAAIVKLKKRWNPVAIALDLKGPVGSLVDELAAQGIRVPETNATPAHGDLAIPKAYEVASACGQMADAIRQGTVRHIDQALLTGAINGASTRPLGEAWAWNRRSSLVDISPLVAVTLARWALIVRESAIEPEYDVLDSFI